MTVLDGSLNQWLTQFVQKRTFIRRQNTVEFCRGFVWNYFHFDFCQLESVNLHCWFKITARFCHRHVIPKLSIFCSTQKKIYCLKSHVFCAYYKSQWASMMFGPLLFFKISSLLFHRWKKCSSLKTISVTVVSLLCMWINIFPVYVYEWYMQVIVVCLLDNYEWHLCQCMCGQERSRH